MEELLDYVKLCLNVPFCDKGTERIIRGQIEAVQTFLMRFDPGIDFDDADMKDLLITGVRYKRANAWDQFRIDYKDEILRLSDKGRIANAESYISLTE